MLVGGCVSGSNGSVEVGSSSFEIKGVGSFFTLGVRVDALVDGLVFLFCGFWACEFPSAIALAGCDGDLRPPVSFLAVVVIV